MDEGVHFVVLCAGATAGVDLVYHFSRRVVYGLYIWRVTARRAAFPRMPSSLRFPSSKPTHGYHEEVWNSFSCTICGNENKRRKSPLDGAFQFCMLISTLVPALDTDSGAISSSLPKDVIEANYPEDTTAAGYSKWYA